MKLVERGLTLLILDSNLLSFAQMWYKSKIIEQPVIIPVSQLTKNYN